MSRSLRLCTIIFCLTVQPLYPILLELQTFKTENGELTIDFLRTIKRIFKKNIFFETGTYTGDTTAIAAQVFDKVYSTELDTRMYKAAEKKFKKNKRIHIYHGDSPHLFKKALPHMHKDIIFWLDAHYCGGGTARSNADSPIIEELEVIKNQKKNSSIIIIDDLREFYTDSWPSLEEAIIALRSINTDYTIVSFGDLLLAYPQTTFIQLSDCLHACCTSRFFDTNLFNYTLNDVLNAEETITSLEGIEKNTFEAYITYNDIKESCDPYILLWKGLLREHSQQYDEAYTAFETLQKQSDKRTINHWRINWYCARTAFKLNKLNEAKKQSMIVLSCNPTFEQAKNLLQNIDELLSLQQMKYY